MEVHCKYDELVDPSKLKHHPKNHNQHPPEQIDRLIKILDYQGWRYAVKVSRLSGYVTSGHGRIAAAFKAGWKTVPVVYQEYTDSDQEYLDVQSDNAIASWAELNLKAINADIPELGPFDIDLLGIKDFEVEALDKYDADSGSLAKKFGVPPFSVFDTRQEYWHERKNYWLSRGIKSYSGRGQVGALSASIKRIKGASESLKQLSVEAGVSIFDPFLAEICYSWFSPKNAVILDPFAGGSVRGLIATWLGKEYHGVDLSPIQIGANKAEALRFNIKPNWYVGDSVKLNDILDKTVLADFVFSCPPYGDLETYSDDENDISNMGLDEFLAAYRLIIRAACDRLKDNRFACFVVGDYRAKDGTYCNFVSETIDAFLNSGLKLYNEIVLINEPGTAALRANRQFSASKKLLKHIKMFWYLLRAALSPHLTTAAQLTLIQQHWTSAMLTLI